MINYKWEILDLKREVEDGYVFNVYYNIIANEDNMFATKTGIVNLERPEEGKLIPYENLTEELILEWIKDKMGEEMVNQEEEFLEGEILKQKQPKEAYGVPWANRGTNIES